MPNKEIIKTFINDVNRKKDNIIYQTSMENAQWLKDTLIDSLQYIEQLETKIKELGKGQQALMQSRRKWKNRYYKIRKKNKELQKSVEQIYDDYQDIGKIAFDYSDKIEQLEKTISRKMSNNKRLSKKYLKERYKNKQLELDKKKLIDKLEKIKYDLEFDRRKNNYSYLYDIKEILEIVKGENQVTVK